MKVFNDTGNLGAKYVYNQVYPSPNWPPTVRQKLSLPFGFCGNSMFFTPRFSLMQFQDIE